MNNVWKKKKKRKWTTYPNYQELNWTDYLLIKQGTKSVKVQLYQQTAFRLTLLRWLFHYIFVSEYRLKVTYLHLKLMLKVLQLSNLFKTPVACTWSLPENTLYLLFQSYLLENVLLCSPSIHWENCSRKRFFFSKLHHKCCQNWWNLSGTVNILFWRNYQNWKLSFCNFLLKYKPRIKDKEPHHKEEKIYTVSFILHFT